MLDDKMHDGGFNTSFAKASYHCLRGLMLLMFLQPTFTLSKISDEQGNAASSGIKLKKRNGIEYVDSRSNYGHSDDYRLPIHTERLFNVPLRATPEAAGSPQCVACRARGRQCLITRFVNIGLCGLAGYLLPEIVLSTSGGPLGEDGGVKVGPMRLCALVLLPRTIGCLYDRYICSKEYSCGVLPDWLPKRQTPSN